MEGMFRKFARPIKKDCLTSSPQEWNMGEWLVITGKLLKENATSYS